MTQTGVYLYAVGRDIRAEEVAECPGVGTAPPRLVAHEGLTAVVSDVDMADFGEEGLRRHLEDLAWLESVARRHDQVVTTAARARPVAPLRLGTVFFDDEGVRRQLQERHAGLTTALDRVEGREEWSVKVVVPTPPRPSAETAEADTSGTAYLMRRRAETQQRLQVSERGAEAAEEVHRRLSEVAEAGRRLPAQDRQLSGEQGTMTLNGTYLVPRDRAGDLRALVERLRSELPDVRLDLTGPFPPYSFVTEDG